MWNLRGSCAPGAIVLVKNIATGRIVGTEDSDADGRYFIAIEAEECDVAEVWQIVGNEASMAAGFVVTPVTANTAPSNTCAPAD